jgi:Putative peptidoglycan binding domain/LysM domain
MAGNYTVKQGDHLSKIAKDFGFSDYHTIWDHPNNADLKQKRQNPNVLFPGDTLFIPDRVTREESAATDQRHQYKMHKPKLKLRLTLEDLYERPIADSLCVLSLGNDSRNVTTDARGRIEQDISADVHNGFFIIQDEQTPFEKVAIPVRIGDLDPVDEVSGQIARLNNLGYFAGDIDKKDDQAFQSAVEEFQCDDGLTVDGKCGPITQAKLKQVHGC